MYACVWVCSGRKKLATIFFSTFETVLQDAVNGYASFVR